MTSQYYGATLNRLAAAGVTQRRIDGVTPAALAVCGSRPGLQRALQADAARTRAETYAARALELAPTAEARAMVRSMAVPQQAFSASRIDPMNRMDDDAWTLAVRKLTRQHVITETIVGAPPPVEPGGHQRCPYDKCNARLTEQGWHAHGCTSTTMTVARHDAVAGAMAKGLKLIGGGAVTVEREPPIRDYVCG